MRGRLFRRLNKARSDQVTALADIREATESIQACVAWRKRLFRDCQKSVREYIRTGKDRRCGPTWIAAREEKIRAFNALAKYDREHEVVTVLRNAAIDKAKGE